jgi:magnesium-transporting ATPase (P-type)
MALFEPTNLLLLGCALIYLLIGDPTDGIVLLGFVLGISLLDAGQQQRSNRALAELARLSTPRSHVRRGDQDLELTADQLLIADLLRLEEGDRLAADAEFQGHRHVMFPHVVANCVMKLPRFAIPSHTFQRTLIASHVNWAK